MACTLEMLPSTAYLSQQDKTTLAVRGHDKVTEKIFCISDKKGNAL